MEAIAAMKAMAAMVPMTPMTAMPAMPAVAAMPAIAAFKFSRRKTTYRQKCSKSEKVAPSCRGLVVAHYHCKSSCRS